MAENVIRYELIFQRALRGMIRDTLTFIAREGLPYPHHYYITLASDSPGVEIPDYILRQYPEQLTIVLEHQFTNLVVEEDQFSVTVGFGPRQERLTIPYAAIRVFHDPGGQPFPLPQIFMDPEHGFGIQFLDLGDEDLGDEAAEDEEDEDESSTGGDVIMLDAFLKPDKNRD